MSNKNCKKFLKTLKSWSNLIFYINILNFWEKRLMKNTITFKYWCNKKKILNLEINTIKYGIVPIIYLLYFILLFL